jgi:hypothetical protein
VGRAVGAELVGDSHSGHRAGLYEKTAEEAPGRGLVPSVLHEGVGDVPVLVDGPPQVLQPSADFDEDLIHVPLVPGLGLPAAQRACVGLPEHAAAAADRFVGDDDPALEHQLLDLAQ